MSAVNAAPLEENTSNTDNNHQNHHHDGSNGAKIAADMLDHASNDGSDKDDPATTAAREDLKHTTISDKEPAASSIPSTTDAIVVEEEAQTDDPGLSDRTKTPEAPIDDDVDLTMKDKVSSPKKKRGRDLDEDSKDLDDDEKIVTEDTEVANGNSTTAERTTRLGPDKKRVRETSKSRLGEQDAVVEETVEEKETSTEPEKPALLAAGDAKDDVPVVTAGEPTSDKKNDKATTSSTAFASSGFASHAATSTSGFGALGSSAKPSVFGGGAASTFGSGFGANKAASATATTTDPSQPRSFGGFGGLGAKGCDNTPKSFASPATGFASLDTAAAPGTFGGGGGFGGGFGASSGQRLSTFAAPATSQTITGEEKPTKAFGAPEQSDEEDEEDEEGSQAGEGSDDDDKESATGEKKKTKVSKVAVQDGEEGEATLLQVRGKLFAMESKEVGWKERGAGTLKVNVPAGCVDYNYENEPIPGSFDPSGNDSATATAATADTDEAVPKVVRLIMRQDGTHRVILNTIIVKAMKFEEKSFGSSMGILFTAFEATQPVNILVRMRPDNAKLLSAEVASIQREL